MKGQITLRELWNKIRLVALPIALQNLVGYALNLVDTIMVGRLGETSIAAVGIGGQIFFLFTVSMFGISSGSSVLIAQYWGKGDKEAVGRVFGLSMLIGAVYSALFAAINLAFPGPISGIFSNEAPVIAQAVDYLVWVAPSFIFSALTTLTVGVVRTVGKTVPPLIFSVVSIGVNTFLNWCLIFGNLGMPELGVAGAAIATLISRVVEFSCLLTYLVWLNRKMLGWKLRQLFRIQREMVFKFIKYSLPVVLNESLWSAGVSVQVAILGQMGSQVLAAYNVVTNIERLSSIFAFGLSNAAAIIIGCEIGAGRRHHAYEYAVKLTGASIAIGLVFTGLLLGTYDIIMLPFNITEETQTLCRMFFYSLCFVSVFRNFNTPVAVGVFRGGGDPNRALVMDLLPMWLGSVPLMALAVFVFHVPPVFILLVFYSDELFKLLISVPGLLSKKWIRDVTI